MCSWVHPRARGVASIRRFTLSNRTGSSPRVRGIPPCDGRLALGLGSIPARAGKPLTSLPTTWSGNGPTSLMRGYPRAAEARARRRRFIPASAGRFSGALAGRASVGCIPGCCGALCAGLAARLSAAVRRREQGSAACVPTVGGDSWFIPAPAARATVDASTKPRFSSDVSVREAANGWPSKANSTSARREITR